MKLKIGNLEGKLETDNPELLALLEDKYAIADPAAFYSPLYKRHLWDGKVRFFSKKTGKFKAGLLPRILIDLSSVGASPEIEITYSYPEETYDYIIDGWTLREYQKNLIDKALSLKKCIIQSPTGSGKTLMMGSLVKAFSNKKILFLFKSKQLIQQTYEYFTSKAPKGLNLEKNYGISIGVNSSDGFILGNVMLCSVFSMEKLLGTGMDHPDVLIVDECHEFSTGKLTSGAIGCFDSALYRYGFTGTVPSNKIKRFTLEGSLGTVVTDLSVSSLIDMGTLAKPFIQVIPMPTSSIDWEDDTYPEIYDKFIINNKTRNDAVVNIITAIKNKYKTAKILVLVKNLEHGKNLNSLIPNSHWLQGSDDTSSRMKIIKKFQKSKKTEVIIGTTILQTGIDIPEITHYINARGLESEIATIQALGRSLRITPEVSSVFVYDFLDKVKYLEDHSKSRIKTYKKEGHTVGILK